MAASVESLEFLRRFGPVTLVGKGAFGRVYRGSLPGDGREVAVKVLLKETTEAVRRRFEREAETLRSLQSPHVIRLYEMDLAHDPPYLAMEWVGAGTLGTLHGRREPAPPADARRVAREMLAGIQDLHDAGLIHRDLKPHNVLLREDRSVALADLGLVGEQEASTISETGQVMGTPRYMPPEVLLGKRWSPRADLFAAGITLWEFAVGQHPSAPFRHALTTFLNPDLELPLMEDVGAYRNPALERLVGALLAHLPEERPASARAAAALLGDEAEAARGDAAALEDYQPGLHFPEPDEQDDGEGETWVDLSELSITSASRARARASRHRSRADTEPVDPRGGPSGARQAPGGTPLRSRALRPGQAATITPRGPAIAMRALAAAGLGLALLTAGMLWSRSGAPPAPGTDLPPLPEEEAGAFPPGWLPPEPALHYLERGRVELAWKTPTKAYAQGSFRTTEGIVEVARGRSTRDPTVVFEAPEPGQVYRELGFWLVDREGSRVVTSLPSTREIRSLPDQVEAYLERVRADGSVDARLEAWQPLARAFEAGVLGAELPSVRELAVYRSLADLEALDLGVAQSCRRRLDVRTGLSPPDGAFDLLPLPEGEIESLPPGETPLHLAAWLDRDRPPSRLLLEFVRGSTLRVDARGAEWIRFRVPRAWLPDRRPAYALRTVPPGLQIRELRLYHD